MKKTFAVIQIILALVLAALTIILYQNNRHLADRNNLQAIQDTLASYDAVLETQTHVYWGFYESLNTHRETLKSLHALNESLKPLTEVMLNMSEFSLFGKKPLESCRDFAVSLRETSENIGRSLQDTESALANFDNEAHQAILTAIDNSRNDLSILIDEVKFQMNMARMTANLLLAIGLIIALLFLLNGSLAFLPNRA